MRSRRMGAVAVMGTVALVLVACGADDTSAGADITVPARAADTVTTMPEGGGETDDLTGLPIIDPFAVEGDIATAGSSTVFPLSEAVAAQFEDEGYGGTITIDSIGSGAGFERFCVAGESDISNASRPIEQGEIEACEEIGRTPVEFRVGTDALAVAISTSNYFVENLTMEELATVFSLPQGSTWDQVNSEFPAHPIALFSPGTDSGTFDYFVEAVFDEDEEPILSANPQLSEDDNVLVQGVAGDGCTEGDLSSPCAVGYFGYAYYTENQGRLRAISIEGVEPSAETVLADYPLARPLFIYSDAGIMAEKPQVARFVAYYLNNVNDVIGDVGYFPAPDDTLQSGAEALRDGAGEALAG